MATTTDCSHNTDPLKLVREGTSQSQRLPAALNPSYAPVNERAPEHSMVFAQSYAALLKYYDSTNTCNLDNDWVPFFGQDVSVKLAVVAIEDIEAYKANIKAYSDYLNNLQANQFNTDQLKGNLGYLYSSIASLANQLDLFKEGLPAEIALKATLQNLIKTQLAPAFGRLIAYYKAGSTLSLVNGSVVPTPTVLILRSKVMDFETFIKTGLSVDWWEGKASSWTDYVNGIAQDASVYQVPRYAPPAPSPSLFEQINYCATHPLFKSVFDQFLKVFARVISEAKIALQATLTTWDQHQPHYALFLSFLQLFEYARSSGNTLTARHLDFYYRDILGLKEKVAQPSHVNLLVELAKQVLSHDFIAGELFKAGKDTLGLDAFFANDKDFVANQAKVAAMETVYRHGEEPVNGKCINKGRIYASPVANSDDGLGAALTSVDQSWHPFYNKVYIDGALAKIRMPEAEIGFAIASHYLLMAEGDRNIILQIIVSDQSYTGPLFEYGETDSVISCFFTTDKGWIEKNSSFWADDSNTFRLEIDISGADPPITPYSSKKHGYNFATDLPMLLIKLKHDGTQLYGYPMFQDVVVTDISLEIDVSNLKSLAVSNDFGPVDTSKPFQPFGASPVAGSALIIGSKEVFQKTLSSASLTMDWQNAPQPYPNNGVPPDINIYFLNQGQWKPTSIPAVSVQDSSFNFTNNLDLPVQDAADFSANEFFGTSSRYGFAKLSLAGNFGQDQYQADLISYLLDKTGKIPNPGKPPVGPIADALSIGYQASLDIPLNSSSSDSFAKRLGQFFHLAPFGTAEQHPYLNSSQNVFLLPQFNFQRDHAPFKSEAEFYIGISGLLPPQNLSLLFQVADGTANPLAVKPKPHIDWSYLQNNRWTSFDQNALQDGTGELLASGIITLAVPREASPANTNTILPDGLVWIRAAVHDMSDAICKLRLVAAQALQASFIDKGNSPSFPATPLPAGTISKLDQPDSEVKTISQPFPSFGGRGAEQPDAFYTRISERLRHKDRAIDLWDYERLILDAFPQISKVKCLNHTYFGPSDSVANGICQELAPGQVIPACSSPIGSLSSGIYRELAPGHVTIVTIPNQQFQNLRDPLRPYTSLGLLTEIAAFLENRVSCFVKLHVKNPQFEEVRTNFNLHLHDGFDGDYYTKLLQQAITRFLSPWAFADSGSPTFGGKIYKSVLINFIENQPYVDYVTDFKLFQDINGCTGSIDQNEIEGSLAVSILVSAPSGKHNITLINPASANAAGETCSCEA